MTRRLGATALVCTLVTFLLVPPAAVNASDTIHLVRYSFNPTHNVPDVAPTLRAEDPAPGETAYYLVQLTGPPTAERKEAVRSAGGELVAYVPDNTYIVRMGTDVRDRVAESASVCWTGLFHPAYKISPAIGTQEFRDPRRAQDSRLTLKVRVFQDPESSAGTIRSLGADVLETSDDGFQKLLVVHAEPERVNEIARMGDVWWIEEMPEFILLNSTTKWVVQSNVSGSTPVWDKGIHGEDQLAIVMDSGLDYNSCWFRETGGAAPGPGHRKVINYSLYGGNAYDGCDIGHGTHVCGTLAGDQSYINPGNFGYNGMAYKAKLALQDVGTDDEWSCTMGTVSVPTSLTAAFNAGYSLGGRVHSNSWGSTSNSYDSYSVDVDNAMWLHPDFLVVFAAGNSGSASGTVGSPGTAKNCITVGATRQAPQQDVIPTYSSRGPTSDNRFKPTVMAPGGDASHLYISSADNNTGNPPAQTCNVASSPFQGTSMATPAVAGCALLVRQYYTEGWYPSGQAVPEDEFTPSAALVKATVVNSATDISTADIPNNNEGWGRVLLDDALYFDGDARELIVEDVTPGVSQGATETFEFEIDSSTVPLEIVLVWTDYPATSGASVALQNNLNLTVTAPGGATYLGNVFSGGQSATGGTADSRNVEEVVRRNSPTPGVYTVRVQGVSVPYGPQPFALASTGSFANWPIDMTDAALTAFVPPERPFEIRAISPNPFNPSTTLSYELFPVETGKARLTIRVYAVDGRRVSTLVDRVQDPGRYTAIWDGRTAGGAPAASGIYFCEVAYGGERETRKIVLLK